MKTVGVEARLVDRRLLQGGGLLEIGLDANGNGVFTAYTEAILAHLKNEGAVVAENPDTGSGHHS
jgi:hypothetical protein